MPIAEPGPRVKRRSARVLLVALLLLHQPARTATIVVDGGCALADAIDSANTDSSVGGCTAGSGTDEIQLTSDVRLTAELPRIDTDMLLEGNDHTVARDASAADFRLFWVSGASFALRNATVTNGRGGRGGGIYAGGSAVLRVSNSILTANEATIAGGAISVYEAEVLIENSTLSNNSADSHGGGLHADGSRVLLVGSTLAGNTAGSKGGGLYGGWDSEVTVLSSTITDSTGSLGGGVDADQSKITLINSTVSGNTATNSGGGIYSEVYSDVDLLNSTVAGNGNHNLYAGFTGGNITVERSIVANATSGGNCAGTGGIFIGLDNFDDDGTCTGADPIVAGVDFDSTLADNGGPTETHALLSGSVAADAVACGLTTDQRGFARDDGTCDSGSFELDAQPSGVGGLVSEMLGLRVRCQSLTTLQAVTFDLGGATQWNCEAQGLTVAPGDSVRQSVVGRAIDGASGEAIGVRTSAVVCRNLTTGQSVPVPMPTASWDCQDQGGLLVDPGDRVEQVFTGRVP